MQAFDYDQAFSRNLGWVTEAEQQRLKISREEEYAQLEQEREIAVRRAEQEASIRQNPAGAATGAPHR